MTGGDEAQENECFRITAEPVKIIKNLQKTLFTWRVFVCYTTEVASHAHLLRVQKYTRSEIPADGALRCEAGSERKRIHAEEFNQKEKKT